MDCLSRNDCVVTSMAVFIVLCCMLLIAVKRIHVGHNIDDCDGC